MMRDLRKKKSGSQAFELGCRRVLRFILFSLCQYPVANMAADVTVPVSSSRGAIPNAIVAFGPKPYSMCLLWPLEFFHIENMLPAASAGSALSEPTPMAFSA
jgi:hypothetical protein